MGRRHGAVSILSKNPLAYATYEVVGTAPLELGPWPVLLPVLHMLQLMCQALRLSLQQHWIWLLSCCPQVTHPERIKGNITPGSSD